MPDQTPALTDEARTPTYGELMDKWIDSSEKANDYLIRLGRAEEQSTALMDSYRQLEGRFLRALSLIHHLMRSRRMWWSRADHAALLERNTLEIANRNVSAYRAVRADLDSARRWAAWFAAERDYVIRCRAQELAAIAGRQKQYREKISEFRAYLAEIVDALGEPEDTRFDVLPEAVSDLRDRIAELEAAQPGPAGYVVVTRNPEGGVHRSATVWDSLERATAAGDFQAKHAEGTGCSAAVHELGREVNGDA